MANLGTLWFDVDLDLTKLEDKIKNGGRKALESLKLQLSEHSLEDIQSQIRGGLQKSFNVRVAVDSDSVVEMKRRLTQELSSIKFSPSINGTDKLLSGISAGNQSQDFASWAKEVQTVTTSVRELVEQLQKMHTATASVAKDGNTQGGIFDPQKFITLQEAIDKIIGEINRLQQAFTHLGENSSLSNLSTMINGLAITLSSLSNAIKLQPLDEQVKALLERCEKAEAKLREVGDAARYLNERAGAKTQQKAANIAETAGINDNATVSLEKYSRLLYDVENALYRLNNISAAGGSKLLNQPIEQLEQMRKMLNELGVKGENGRIIDTLLSESDYAKIRELFNAIKTGYKDVASESDKYTKSKQNAASATSHLTQEEQKLAASIKSSTDSMRGQSQVLSDLKTLATQYLSVWGAQSFVNSIIQTGGLLEQQRMSIGAILGDLSQANHLFGQIQQLALKSPFGVVQLDTMSKQLTAYNFKYSELYDWTKRLADISAATGTEVSRLALALGHVRSEGALSGYTLRQFAMGNVPLLQTLSQQLGKTTSEIRKMTREKAITYEDVEQALRTLTEEGGIFFNAQEVMSNALNAKFKNLHDAFDIMFGKMAESGVGDALKGLAETLTVMAKHWKEVGAQVIVVTGAFAAYKAIQATVNAGLMRSGVMAGQYSAKQLELLATTGKLNRNLLLQAVAAGKVSAADAEAAGAVFNLTKAQLDAVAATGKTSAAFDVAAIAGGKYATQTQILASQFKSASWMSMTKWATGAKLAWTGLAGAIDTAKAAVTGFLATMWPLLAISAVTETFMRMSRKSEELDNLLKDLSQTANEASKNLGEVTKNFSIGGSEGKDAKQLNEDIDEMVSQLKDYSENASETFKNAFAIDAEGKSVHSLAEQYDILAHALANAKKGYERLGEHSDIIANAIDSVDWQHGQGKIRKFLGEAGKWMFGWMTSDTYDANRGSLNDAIENYVNKVREARIAENELLKDRLALVKALKGAGYDWADQMNDNILVKTAANMPEYFHEEDRAKVEGFWNTISDSAKDALEKVKDSNKELDKAFQLAGGKAQAAGKAIFEALSAEYGSKDIKKWPAEWRDEVMTVLGRVTAGVSGFADMSEEQQLRVRNAFLHPFDIKLTLNNSEAEKRLTDMQIHLNNLVGEDWVVKLKLETVGSFEDLYDQLDKTVKKSGETLKKLGGSFSEKDKARITSMATDISTLTEKEKEYREAYLKRQKAVKAANQEGFKLSSLDKENKKNESAANKAETAAEKAAKARTKQAEAQMKIDEELAKQRFELEDAIADARVASIENNAERERVQREEEFKKQERQLDRQVEEWKRKSFELAKKEHEANPKNKTISFFDTPVGQAGWQGQSLTAEQAAIDKAQRQALADNEKRRIKEENETLIASHADYIDKKIALDKKYKESITKINRAIFDAEKRGDKETVEQLKRTRAEAEKNRAKEQADLTFKQLQEDPEYIRAFEDLDNVSTETLEHLIEMFEKAKKGAARSLDPKDLKQYTDTIEQMWDSIRKNDPSHALIVARENWKKANDKVKKAESDLYNVRRGGFRMMTVYNKETKEYEQQLMTIADAEKALSIAKEERKKATKKLSLADEEARKIIDELADSVGNLGSMIGGTAGEILGAVSSVAKYTTTILTAHDQIAKLGTSALDTFQKASVVLSLITTGMQIAQSIASLFSSNLEEIIAKNKMLAQMAIAVSNYRLEVEKAMREEDQWFSSTKLQGLVNQWQSSTDAAAEYFNYIKHAQEDYDRTVKQYSYVGVGEFLEKIVHSGDYFNALVNTGDGYASLQALVKTTFNEDLFGADGLINVDVAKKAIEVWGDQIQGEGRAIIEHLIELAEEGTSKWMESLREYVSELYSPIADDLTDALFEWYETGVDVMDAFNDKARDTFQDVAKEMMKQLVNTMVFDELKNKLIAAYTVYTQTVSAGPEAGSANSNNTQDALNALRASLNAALIEFENTTKEALPELQAFMELLGQMSDDIFGQASDDLPDYFDNIKSAWQSTLLDMKGDAEQLGKEIARIMFESLVKKNVLNDEFNEWLKGWVERYEAATNAESEAERNALLAKLYDERAEKVKELTDRTKEYAEMAGYAADADEQLTNSLENLKDTLLDSLLDAESDAGDLGKKIAQSLIKDMLTEMLAAEKYANQIEAIHELWQNILVGGGSWTNENGETFDMQSVLGMIAKLNNDIAEDESIAALADQYKQLTEEINGANTSFGDFHDSFMDAMLDMENGVENFKKKLHETLVKDIIDKKVFGEAFTINGNPYENFEEYQKDWTKRYLDALEAGDTDLMRELVKEMEERETAMAEAAEQYAKELQEAAKDTTFTGMSDSFLSALMDTNKTAEDWAQDIGKTIAKKIFEGMVAEKTLLQGIQDVWDAAVAGATDESGKVDWDKVLANAELQQVAGSTKEEFENLQKAWEALCKSLGVTLDAKELPLGDIDSTILESLTDAEESAEDFGKKIALKLMNEMLSKLVNTRYLDEMKAIREMWQHALNGDVDEEGNAYTIERVTQAIEALRAEISGSTEISNLATQIQDLSKASAQADESFKSMGDSWTSVLTDMDATAEDFGRQIGQNLVSKLVKKLIVDKELQFYLNNIQDAYNQAIESGMSLEDAVAAVEPKIDEAVEATEKWKPVIDEINQKFQKLNEETPFDDLRSRFRSELMDMSSDVNSFASDLNKSITEAFIDAFVLADFDDRLEEWKKRYSAIMKSDTMTEAERAKALKDLQNEIVEAKEGYVEGARSIQDLLGYGEYKDQDATVNMADKATYDQFEQYLGIAVSQQITAEHQLGVQQQILSTLQGMAGLSDPVNDSLLTQVALANSHLSNIYNVNYKMYQSLETRLQTIEMNTAYLKKL